MKKEVTKKSTREENRWVDIHNDSVMREMGVLRSYEQKERDASVWTKTPYEKRILKEAKYAVRKRDMHFNNIPIKHVPLYDKLVIYLKKNKSFDKTTYSTMCWQHEIGSILLKYCEKNKKSGAITSVISKYSYNGKTYKAQERPFWY